LVKKNIVQASHIYAEAIHAKHQELLMVVHCVQSMPLKWGLGVSPQENTSAGYPYLKAHVCSLQLGKYVIRTTRQLGKYVIRTTRLLKGV